MKCTVSHVVVATYRLLSRQVKDERGQNVLEAALVLPLIVLIAVLLMDFGMAIETYNETNGAVREAVQFGARINGLGADEDETVAVANCEARGLSRIIGECDDLEQIPMLHRSLDVLTLLNPRYRDAWAEDPLRTSVHLTSTYDRTTGIVTLQVAAEYDPIVPAFYDSIPIRVRASTAHLQGATSITLPEGALDGAGSGGRGCEAYGGPGCNIVFDGIEDGGGGDSFP